MNATHHRYLSWLIVAMLLAPATAAAEQGGADSDNASSPTFEGGARVPVRATLVPLVGVPGLGSSDATPSYAINVVGRNHGLEGLELGLLVNTERAYVDGAQFALAGNWVSGPTRGFQGSLGLNVSEGEVRGVSAALGLNLGHDLEGVQASLGGNLALGHVQGAQFGGANWANDEVEGVQIGFANKAGDVAGFQGGLVNVGREVDGVQIGLLNVAKRSEVSLGLLNINWARPLYALGWMNETGMVSMGLRHGSEHVYQIVRMGYQPFEPQRVVAPGVGFGGHFPLGALGSLSTYLETEALYNVALPVDTATHIPSHWGQLRLTFGMEFSRRVAAFAGVSANGIAAEREGRVLAPPTELPSVEVGHGGGFWPGFYGGVRF